MGMGCVGWSVGIAMRGRIENVAATHRPIQELPLEKCSTRPRPSCHVGGNVHIVAGSYLVELDGAAGGGGSLGKEDIDWCRLLYLSLLGRLAWVLASSSPVQIEYGIGLLGFGWIGAIGYLLDK